MYERKNSLNRRPGPRLWVKGQQINGNNAYKFCIEHSFPYKYYK